MKTWMILVAAGLLATVGPVRAAAGYGGVDTTQRERVVAYRNSPNGIFDRELQNLSDLARTRPANSVRVLVGVALEPTEVVDIATRARSERAAARYSAAVARRQDMLIAALGERFQQPTEGTINRVNGLPYVSLFLTANEVLQLEHNPHVSSVVEEGVATEFLVDTIPLIDADDSHALGYTGTGRWIAVIDSGVQTDHPFFGSRVSAGACYSTPDPGYSAICAGGAASGSTTLASGGPCNYSGGPGLDCGHGTHVGGVALGSTTGKKGVAPSANLITIQASSLTSACDPLIDPAPCRRYLESDVVNALMRVHTLRTTYPIAVVNLSLGFANSLSSNNCEASWPSLSNAIDTLDYANIAVVVASGNLGSSGSSTNNNKLPAPACILRTISVGAVTKADVFAWYTSANSSMLDVLAPGGITGSSSTLVESSVPGSTYATVSGTSQAAPHVAGAIALMRIGFPYASAAAMERQFRNTGPSIYVSYPGYAAYYKRRLETDAAMSSIPTAPTSSVGPVSVTNDMCYGSNLVTWTAITGTDIEYQIEASPYSNFSSGSLLALVQADTADSLGIDVSATRYIRVRACEGVACGAWQAASTPATYFNGCP